MNIECTAAIRQEALSAAGTDYTEAKTVFPA